MTGHVKVGGAWKTVAGASVKVGGAWKAVSAAYTKVGGTWKQWLSSVKPDRYFALGAEGRIVARRYSSTGFGTRYANISSDPNGGSANGASFSPSGTAIIAGIEEYEFGHYPLAYSFSDSGFGVKYSQPASYVEGIIQYIAFHPAENAVVLTGPGYTINSYAWSNGWGIKYAKPSVAGSTSGLRGNFSPNGAYFAFGSGDRVQAYDWSNGFGAKLANPSTIGAVSEARFSPNGQVITLAESSTPYISAYPWSNGFGARYASPASPPTYSTRAIDWTPSGSHVLVALGQNPYLAAYSWSSGWGTRLANPSINVNALTANFSPSGNSIAGVHGTGEYGLAWSNGFGVQFANPVSPASYPGQMQSTIA